MKNFPVLPASEITPEAVYRARRSFMAGGAALGLAAFAPRWSQAAAPGKLGTLLPSKLSTDEGVTLQKHATTYNNFYEFGVDKSDPAERAQALRVRPWTVQIDGLVKKPLTVDIDALLKLAPLEERIYRLRCVEGWSMVIPWVGYSLSSLLKRVEPLGSAKFIEFQSAVQADTMPELRRNVLDWPYVEGLRLDEAMHPLTLLSLGMYGDVLPKQNGAPVRIIVPWKYGFKSGKSVVRIRFTEHQPETSWVKAGPNEYGFYSNVNPAVDHPRWSQARERRIGDFGKRETLPFNGYADQVAALYTGMDLRKFF